MGHEGGQGGGASLGNLKLLGVTLGAKEKVGGDKVENHELGAEPLHAIIPGSLVITAWITRGYGPWPVAYIVSSYIFDVNISPSSNNLISPLIWIIWRTSHFSCH
jgi:hypothetical protein